MTVCYRYYVAIPMVALICYFAYCVIDFVKAHAIQTSMFFSQIRSVSKVLMVFSGPLYSDPQYRPQSFLAFTKKSARKHVAHALFLIVFYRSRLCQNNNPKISGNEIWVKIKKEALVISRFSTFFAKVDVSEIFQHVSSAKVYFRKIFENCKTLCS